MYRINKKIVKKTKKKMNKTKKRINKRRINKTKRRINKTKRRINKTKRRIIGGDPLTFKIEFIRHGPSLSNIMTRAEKNIPASAAMRSVNNIMAQIVRGQGFNADLNHFIKDVSLCHFGIVCAIEAGNSYKDNKSNIVLCSCMLRAIQTAIFLFPNKKIVVLPHINEEAAGDIERELTGFARSPYRPISITKDRVNKTIEILTDPKLIHFGGDEYTLNRIKDWKVTNNITDKFNIDYSFFEFLEDEYSKSKSSPAINTLYSANPKEFFKILSKFCVMKNALKNTKVVPCVTHGYTIRNSDIKQGLIGYINHKKQEGSNLLKDGVELLIDNRLHNNIPNCGSIITKGKYEESDISFNNIILNVGMNNPETTVYTPFTINYKNFNNENDLFESNQSAYNVNDNKEKTKPEKGLPRFKNYANNIKPINIVKETWFCYNFMHSHDNLRGSKFITTPNCCSPTEYFLEYCAGRGSQNSFEDDREEHILIYPTQPTDSIGKLSELNHNFELKEEEGDKYRKLLYFKLNHQEYGSEDKIYYLPGIGLYDSIFDEIRPQINPDMSKEDFIKLVVTALTNGSYYDNIHTIEMYFTKPV